MANLIKQEIEVDRWIIDGTFNPGSRDQILAYMDHVGVKSKPSKHSKTNTPSTDEQAMKKLERKDAFFGMIVDYRKVDKLRGTYVTSNIIRLDSSNRVHPKFLHNPSTWRLSCVDPNWQNIPIRDMDEEDSLARQFRQCVVAAPGCVLVEADYSGIEAVETGYFSHDPDYIRLARHGIHSYLTSHLMKEPADLTWSDEQLGAHLAYIKKKYKDGTGYYAMKRTVHLTNYGGSPWMMQRAEPSIFPTIKSAFESQNFYLDLVPKLKVWQKAIRARATKENFLGGKDHPYKFKHFFWDVIAYDRNGRQQPGADWNKVVAFYPQSAAAGVLYDTALDLQDPASPNYIGDLFHGKTPLRALIHDSILLEVPETKLDTCLERLARSMMRPVRVQPLDPAWEMGEFLKIDVDVKVGPNWADMEAAT
jgi:hypothetical protein